MKTNKYLEKTANIVRNWAMMGAAGGSTIGALKTPKEDHTRFGNAIKGGVAGGVVGALIGSHQSKGTSSTRPKSAFDEYTEKANARRAAYDAERAATEREREESYRQAHEAASRPSAGYAARQAKRDAEHEVGRKAKHEEGMANEHLKHFNADTSIFRTKKEVVDHMHRHIKSTHPEGFHMPMHVALKHQLNIDAVKILPGLRN